MSTTKQSSRFDFVFFILAGSEVSPTTSLNEYLRDYLHLHGTKAMCHEGGCGACVVSVSQPHPATKEKHTFSVNSVSIPLYSTTWELSLFMSRLQGQGAKETQSSKLTSDITLGNALFLAPCPCNLDKYNDK